MGNKLEKALVVALVALASVGFIWFLCHLDWTYTSDSPSSKEGWVIVTTQPTMTYPHTSTVSVSQSKPPASSSGGGWRSILKSSSSSGWSSPSSSSSGGGWSSSPSFSSSGGWGGGSDYSSSSGGYSGSSSSSSSGGWD